MPKIQVRRSSTAGDAIIFRKGRQYGCGKEIGLERSLGLSCSRGPIVKANKETGAIVIQKPECYAVLRTCVSAQSTVAFASATQSESMTPRRIRNPQVSHSQMSSRCCTVMPSLFTSAAG